MPSGSGTDFPVTRQTLDSLHGWVRRLAAPVLPAKRVPTRKGFVWRFTEETPLALMVAKAVRIASGLRAAMLLADTGFITESACLLRIGGDLAVEIVAIGEGELRGQKTKAQQEFVTQFFSRPTMGDVLETGPQKKAFVKRDELLAAHTRLAEAAGQDKEEIRELIRQMTWGYDGYVHGSYSSAMELYHGGHSEFMLQGHEDEGRRRVHRAAVSSKVVEALNAFRMVAIVERNEQLSRELGAAAARLMSSRESALGADPS